jgi:hypothetical protein
MGKGVETGGKNLMQSISLNNLLARNHNACRYSFFILHNLPLPLKSPHEAHSLKTESGNN